MTTGVSFADVQAFLDAIADANGAISNSPHDRFWSVSYQEFITGHVPNVKCNGRPVPIVDRAAPLMSPFFRILVDSNGWCNKRQMPGGGPFITQDAFVFTLADGTTKTGAEIRHAIEEWLSNGFPEAVMATAAQRTFRDIQAMLDAVAQANGAIDSSPHIRFWNVPYAAFIDGFVPGVTCKGARIPIMDKTFPLLSPFYRILADSNGWCDIAQMPFGGPALTDAVSSFTLADGTVMSGKEILSAMEQWLTSGYPEA